VRLGVRVQANVWPVLADAAQLNQVLMNLCLNARDAMPAGGDLVLEAANVTLAEGSARFPEGRRPGAFVRLRVRDTGHGIAPEVLPRIFEPFFTTKPLGQGTGLGLALVFGIVQQHQGWVECDSAVGRGTSFDVYLPRCDRDPEAPAADPDRTESRGGSETILLVEDERLLRELGHKLLHRHGYRVLVVADGQEAVDVYLREQGHIDLVLLDLRMPRLSGPNTLRKLRAIDPGVRVVVISGFSHEQSVESGVSGVLGFVPKPYREQDLVAAVRAALDRSKEGGERATPPAEGGSVP
jgi:CheY-like chemotaxis protein